MHIIWLAQLHTTQHILTKHNTTQYNITPQNTTQPYKTQHNTTQHKVGRSPPFCIENPAKS